MAVQRRWTEAEIETVRGMGQTHTARQIAAVLGRSYWGVRWLIDSRNIPAIQPGAPGMRRPAGPRFDGTPAQHAAIRTAAGVLTVQETARQLGLCESTARRYAGRLGVAYKPALRRWTAAEDATLRGMEGKGSIVAAEALGRTRKSVLLRARELGMQLGNLRRETSARHIERTGVRKWTPAEDARIVAMASEGTAAIAAALGRSGHAVRYRASRIGVSIPYVRAGRKVQARIVMRPWTPAEDAAIRLRAGETSDAIGAVLGRSALSVRHRASRLGVQLLAMGAREVGSKRPARVREVTLATHGVRPVAALYAGARPARIVTHAAAILANRHGIRPGMPSLLEYCRCGAPVWDWEKHFERQGHRRNTHLVIAREMHTEAEGAR